MRTPSRHGEITCSLFDLENLKYNTIQLLTGYYIGYSVSGLTILFKRIVVSSPVDILHIFCISETNRLFNVLLSNDDNEK